MKNDLVIIGGGAFARDVLWLIEENNKILKQWNILGFIDNKGNAEINGYEILGGDDWLLHYKKKINAVIAISNPLIKQTIFKKLSNNESIVFPNIIAHDAKIGYNVKIGIGCVICSSVILPVDSILDDFVTVNLASIIEHDAHIESFATLAPRVTVCGNVNVGSSSQIGVGTNIIQGVSIGKNSIIGAGSVVINNIPPNCTAVGVPAKIIKQNNRG